MNAAAPWRRIRAALVADGAAWDDASCIVGFLSTCSELEDVLVSVMDRDEPVRLDLSRRMDAAREILACDEARVRVRCRDVDGEVQSAGFVFVFGNGDDTTLADHSDTPMGRFLANGIAIRSARIDAS